MQSSAFPPTSFDEWRRRVESELAGVAFERALVRPTLEGFARQPLYTAEDPPAGRDPAGFPGLPPYTRGGHPLDQDFRGWTIAQEVAGPSVATARAAIRSDVASGVRLLWLRGDHATRRGLDPDDEAARSLVARGGIPLTALDDAERLLDGVDLSQVAVVVDAGANALPGAALLVETARRQGIDPDKLHGGFGCDPLAALAADGSLPGPLDTAFALMADLAAWSHRNAPGMRAVLVSAVPYHDAGATAVDELALATATGVEYLRRLNAAGLDVDTVAAQIQFAFSVGRDLFIEIAKLRAARLLWAKVVRASGGSAEARAMHLHARGSTVTRTRCDPWGNLLRGTAESFAAAVGGADSIVNAPFDEVLGPREDPDGQDAREIDDRRVAPRRIAAHTHHILKEESHLAQVLDPAGGSWYVESLTDELARAAWTLFQDLESRGGMARCLTSGRVAEILRESAEKRRRAVAKRREAIVGVSDFPNLKAEIPEPETPDFKRLGEEAAVAVARYRSGHDAGEALAALAATGDGTPGGRSAATAAAAAAGATLGALSAALWGSGDPVTTSALPRGRLAEPFEELQIAGAGSPAERGKRPRVFLAKIGTPAEHRARAGFAANFFAAAGVEPVAPEGFEDPQAAAAAFAESQAEVAVVCSTDERYPELVPALAPLLKERGARRVYLAGRPGEREAACREAGIDEFIFLGCDVHGVLRALLAELGVLA
ncbi:MAG: methylmalonyl-CoA mutase [bacterium]|nr:methylmalonyl-CoA mutase [bacterium]